MNKKPLTYFSFHLSNSCPISLQLNSSTAICRFPLIFPFTLCIEPTLVKFLPTLLHQNCSSQGHQVTSYWSFQWSIISPHLSWPAAFYGIDHSLLFEVVSFGLQNTTVSVFLLPSWLFLLSLYPSWCLLSNLVVLECPRLSCWALLYPSSLPSWSHLLSGL